MGKLSKNEVEVALAEAGRLRESGEDEFFIGRALLNSHHRLQLLDEVYRAASAYMRGGESAQLHTRLVRALEIYRRYDEAAG